MCYNSVYNNITDDQIKMLEPFIDSLYSIIEDGRPCCVTKVKTPFILPGNYFDLHEANNTVESVNVNITETATFTGGAHYEIYEVLDLSKPSFVVQGNEEEGFNLFLLN